MGVKKNSDFYLSVIDGNYSELSAMFQDEPVELQESMILNHAFDQLEELGNGEVIRRLLKYVDGTYNNKTTGTLMLLGVFGTKSEESLVENYLDAKNFDISYAALCSICNLLVRGELSEVVAERTTLRLTEMLSVFECSKEEAVEAALALNLIGYQGLDELLENVVLKAPCFLDDYRSYLEAVN